ncbi:hypothetical protein [uncultured Nisaea sp.]|jgi:uncharacterized membrane protein YdjX (TVP38/TMEM64 family)|uniref:hypothetical protein n=1 Tax=uncultured Nisaea sp. TaxID=538215 RepID=UPI0030EBAE7C|tara:strand:+ start:2405 stop:2668 length:264 start_codon:yes stop_codon:yes gene_type:complete
MRPASPSTAAKFRDAAFLLPVAGFFFLLPPVIDLFTARVSLFGIPLIVAYVFGLWTALTVIAFWFSRRLHDPEPHANAPADISSPGR